MLFFLRRRLKKIQPPRVNDMSREKQGFRDTIAALNEMFPDQGMVGRAEIAKFAGVHPTTVDRWVKAGKINMKTPTGRLSKADLARQICL